MRSFWQKVATWFGAERHYDELAEEMQLHLELRTRKLRETGMSQQEAEMTARRTFGNAMHLREDCRSAWGVRWWDELRQDVTYSWRTMRRNWMMAGAAVLTITLGIAANTAVFAYIDALILRPLPVPRPERLAMLTMHEWTQGADMPAFCYPEFEIVAKRVKSVEGLFTWNGTQFTVGRGADAQQLGGGVASGEYYKTLGVGPALGRFFGPADDTAAAQPVAVLSYALWQQSFAGKSSAIGSKIYLDGHPFTVIGVEPRGFPTLQVGTVVQVTIPIHANAALNPKWDMLHQTSMWWLTVFGRLRPGATLAGAAAEMRTLTPEVFETLHMKPDDMDFSSFHGNKPRNTLGAVSGAHGNRMFVAQFEKPLYVLIGISLLVLGIGSLNVANLMLARAVARERELAVRLVLGARLLRVVRQLMTESLLLCLLGTLAGAFTAFWITHIQMNIAVQADVRMDWRVFAFLSLVSVAVMLLFGLVPAVRGVTLGAAALKSGRVGQLRESARLSHIMVCTQIALSLALVSGAFVFSKSFYTLITQDPGFVRKNLVFCGVDVDRSGMNAVQTSAFFAQLLEKLRADPDISSVALTGVVPLTGNYAWSDLSAKEYPNLSREQRQLYTHRVSPEYFKTMQIPLLAGRDFAGIDSASKVQLGVLSEQAARLYFPGRSAIGETLDVEGTPLRIIGVVKDAQYQTLKDTAPPTLYYDYLNTNGAKGEAIVFGATSLMIRTTRPAGEIAAAVRKLVRASGQAVSVNAAMTLDQQIESMLVSERLLAYLATGFAVIGCLLAAVGLYGMIAYSVTRRTPEIGVRLALGAGRFRVVWHVSQDAARLAAIGLGVGLGITYLAGRGVSSLLYHTRPVDPWLMTGTIGVLTAVIAVAAIVPAVRAARIDPMTALRWE